MKIHSTIACNLDTQVLSAALPLLQAERVAAIEWSFDTLYKFRSIPEWFTELLQAFGEADRLIGHGVYFSLFKGQWSAEQAAWLEQLQKLTQTFNFDHITEHFGFMTGADFHRGAPTSIPFNATTLAIGQDRLKRIAAAAQCPVGLENLAFAYSLDRVKEQGLFLDQLLDAVNGFIILDLHNLYCQVHNFDITFDELLACYPLQRVREIHISGGSWQASTVCPDQQIRRDTHDEAVPTEVFQMLEQSMGQCPQLKYVVLEQLGTGLRDEAAQEQFQKDFLRMDDIVQGRNRELLSTSSLPATAFPFSSSFPEAPNPPVESSELYAQQIELSQILETAPDYAQAEAALKQSSLAQSDWQIEAWAPEMLETALLIAQKWKDGF